MHHNLRQQRQRRLQSIPYPHGEVFAGRVFEAGHIVEIVVVELVVERLERLLDFSEIDHPAKVRINRTGDMQLDTKRMPVHAAAFVPSWHVRQAMRSFEGERLEQFHGDSWHEATLILAGAMRGIALTTVQRTARPTGAGLGRADDIWHYGGSAVLATIWISCCVVSLTVRADVQHIATPT